MTIRKVTENCDILTLALYQVNLYYSVQLT